MEEFGHVMSYVIPGSTGSKLYLCDKCFSLQVHVGRYLHFHIRYYNPFAVCMWGLLSILKWVISLLWWLIRPLTSPLQPTFLVELSKVLANPGNTQVARVAAGLQVKNSLTSKDPDVKAQYQQRWLAIDANARREIKNYVRNHLTFTKYMEILYTRLCPSPFCTR